MEEIRNCIRPVLVNANNTSHFRNSEGQQNKSRQRDFPFPQPHIRILYWLCGEGGSLAQVTVHRQNLEENEIKAYEKNTKSTIST